MDLGIEAPDVALPVLYFKKGSWKYGIDRSEKIEIINISFSIEIGTAWIFAGNRAGQKRKVNRLDSPGIIDPSVTARPLLK